MIRIVFYDDNDIPRVWAEGVTAIEAAEKGRQVLKDYRREKPDVQGFRFKMFNNGKPMGQSDVRV